MTGRRRRLESTLAATLDERGADAFVHAGRGLDPAIRYCLDEDVRESPVVRVLAFDGESWLVRTASLADATHPAADLAEDLASRGLRSILSPRSIPHDAALYLAEADLNLASTDAVSRARARKTSAEVDRVAAAQAAASAGVRRAAAVLADATAVDGDLRVGDEALTAETLRRAVDRAVVDAGAFPSGTTAIATPGGGSLNPGEPIVVSLAPREPGGYRGALARTLVVAGEGGPERRAHVAITRAFRSARAFLTADARSVTAVEADLDAEIRAFGFVEPDDVETRVRGVGLDPVERPVRGSDEVGPGRVVCLEAAVGAGSHRVRLAELVVVEDDGPRTLAAPARSLDPTAALDED